MIFNSSVTTQATNAWSDASCRYFKTLHKELYITILQHTTFLPKKSSIARRLFHIINNMTDIPLCSHCNLQHCIWKQKTRDYSLFCSKDCSRKSGIEFAKRASTCIDRYGYANPRKSEIVKHKIKKTMTIQFGVDNYFKSSVFKSVRAKQLGELRTNISQLHIPNSSLQLLENRDWMIEQHHTLRKSITQIAKELQYSDVSTVAIRFKNAGVELKQFQSSKAEAELAEYISTLTIEVQRNKRDILQSGRELDIYIPQYQIAVEYCGLFWHNEVTKDRLYHRTKFLECQAAGIKLITIFEDEWINKKDIVKSTIRHLLNHNHEKIFARNCKISSAPLHKRSFFNQYHIQGDGPSNFSIGLTEKNVLVACASFMVSNEKANLVRYATQTTVVGGLSKLIAQFFQQFPQVNYLYTFADLRWSTGNIYKQLGFTIDKEIPVDYYYIPVGKPTRCHKFAYRHKHLPSKLKVYDPQKSEVENTHANGIYRIWDCGKLRFVLTRK